MMIKAYLIFAAIGFAGFGLALLVDPIGIMASAGLEFADTSAVRTEIRAFYGGLELALAGLILAALRTRRLREGLWLAAVSYGGIGLARALGLVIEQSATTFLISAMVFELAVAAIGLALLRKTG